MKKIAVLLLSGLFVATLSATAPAQDRYDRYERYPGGGPPPPRAAGAPGPPPDGHGEARYVSRAGVCDAQADSIKAIKTKPAIII